MQPLPRRILSFLPVLPSKGTPEANLKACLSGSSSGAKKSLKITELASYLGLLPVSEGHKLIQNFLQSLELPFLVGGCSCTSHVHLRAVRFTNRGDFFPKLLDTL
jgi:hypothetical protein